jgi:hypothetical protein
MDFLLARISCMRDSGAPSVSNWRSLLDIQILVRVIVFRFTETTYNLKWRERVADRCLPKCRSFLRY